MEDVQQGIKGGNMSVIAVIFDYDDTITPDSTTQLLEHYHLDVQKFWEEDFKALVDRGFCPTHAYLKLILDNIGEGKPMEGLTNKKLKEFGAIAAKKQYQGMHSLIRELKRIVEGYQDINVEFYIVSSGLEEIVKENPLIKKEFKVVYGCRLAGDDDSEDSELKYIKRCITFTEKTRYLFEINKGITPETSDKDSSSVNIDIKYSVRRIPFNNMLYIGDGITDIPCFSLVGEKGGLSFGIHHTEKTASYKIKIFKQILQTKRVMGAYAPRYGKSGTLGDFIRIKVRSRCDDILLERKSRGF